MEEITHPDPSVLRYEVTTRLEYAINSTFHRNRMQSLNNYLNTQLMVKAAKYLVLLISNGISIE